jgi:hypothetical protein
LRQLILFSLGGESGGFAPSHAVTFGDSKGLKAKDFRPVVVRDQVSRAFDATNGSTAFVSSV